MNESWALYIDEEGFAQHWDDTMSAFLGLNALMEAICRIGMRVFPEPVDRLFCYQFGDGFLITSDFHEKNLSRAVLITISILRHMLFVKRVARACLVEGNVSDIAGCYPTEVRNQSDRSRVNLGAGLLLISPVLGEGLLRSVGLSKKEPRGPLFLVDSKLKARLPTDIELSDAEGGVISLNWLKGEPDGLLPLQQKAGLHMESEDKRISKMTEYLQTYTSVNKKWKSGVNNYLLRD